MMINRRYLFSRLPASFLTLAGIGSSAVADESVVSTDAIRDTAILVLDREGRKDAWQAALTSEAIARGWPITPEIRHLIDVLDHENWPSYAADEWNTFLSSDLHTLSRCPSDRTPGDMIIELSLPSGMPGASAHSLRNAAHEAFYRLVGFVRGGPFPPIDSDIIHCYASPLPLLATIVVGDHPLDLAMGKAAGEGGLKAVFWTGEYRHGPDIYTQAIILRRPDAPSPGMSDARRRDIAVQVLDRIEALWRELVPAIGAPAFICSQRDYWV